MFTTGTGVCYTELKQVFINLFLKRSWNHVTDPICRQKTDYIAWQLFIFDDLVNDEIIVVVVVVVVVVIIIIIIIIIFSILWFEERETAWFVEHYVNCSRHSAL